MSDLDKIKAKASTKLLSQVSEDELAVRIIETMGRCKRVEGVDPKNVLDTQTPPDVAAIARAAARASILYMAECFGKAVRPQ